MDKKISRLRLVRWGCRLAVALATGASVWANWLHSDKNPAAITINVMPPLLVLAGFEILSHVPRRDGAWYYPTVLVRPLSMMGITGIGAWLSYFHQRDAFQKYSRDQSTAMLLPLAIDGLMIMASECVLTVNAKIEQLQAFKEAGLISTYLPPSQSPKQKPKDGDQKKEKIAEVLKRFPEYSIQDVAKAAGTSLNYVYTVGRALNDPRFAKPQRQRQRNNDQPAVVTAA